MFLHMVEANYASKGTVYKINTRAGEMAQWVKALAAKADLNSRVPSLGSHGRGKTDYYKLSSNLPTSARAPMCPHTCT